MYTQCPDCDTAFRVTAPVLQQAGGRVVCAGCGLAFNALERLTEDPPAAMVPPDDAKGVLETLDELTGPHQIRIEDTGVEWRVIDEDDPDEDFGMHGASDGPERLPDVSGRVEPQASLRLAHAEGAADLQRYDDNTLLPDDFVEERESPIPQRRAEDHVEPRSPEADEAQVDLALGEPDDWMDLLDEVGTARNGSEAKPEHEKSVDTDDDTVERLSLESSALADAAAAAEAPAPVAALAAHAETDELAGADTRPMSQARPEVDESFPSDIDTQFDLQAIELGIDLTGNRELSIEEPVAKPATPAARDLTKAPSESPPEAPAPRPQDGPGSETSEPV
ncbi:MAG: zinc-ribbon domain-containing protein, partial [Woeseiaceae bacterium]